MAACLVGAILVVVFAATLAVVLVLASALVASAALAWRLRRPARRAARMIEARKVGHSWIAYGWDQQP
jgi:cytochrome c biogenesis protein CcdA